MENEAAIPELIFTRKTLDGLTDADEKLAELLRLVESNKVVSINMKSVDLLTQGYADHFFGNAAIEFARKGDKINISFKTKKIGNLVSEIVQESIKISCPGTFGGSETIGTDGAYKLIGMLS